MPSVRNNRGGAIATTAARPITWRVACMKHAARLFFFGVLMTTCRHCHQPFTPKRSTARFCGPTCRVAGHRRPAAPARGAILSVTGHPTTRPTISGRDVTLRKPDLPAGIVPDDRWPGMYRIRLPGGGLSDMFNLTWAKEHLRTGRFAKRRAACHCL